MAGAARALQMVMLLQHLAGEALHPESKLSQEGMAGKAAYFLPPLGREGTQPLPQLWEQDRSLLPHPTLIFLL